MAIEFVELRLYADSTAASYELLPNYVSPQFDVKYNDLGAIEFTYPLDDAKTLGLDDQSLIGAVCGFSNGTTREVERYLIESTDDEKVIDGVRMRKVTGRCAFGVYMEDATVYPSNWKTQTVSQRQRISNVATLTVPTGHGFSAGQKVFIYGVDATFDGEATLTATTATTVSYSNTGANVTATASTGTVAAIVPTGHEFIEQTVGTIMRTLIQRAKDRGCFPFLTETSFSGTQDSENAVWNALHTQQYATGTSYYQILREFMDRAYIDAWLEGNDLRIVNGGNRGTHIDIGTVELRPAHNVSEMTTTTQSTESATTVLIEGEEGTAVERHNAAFQTTIGRRRERYVQQGGIMDAGVLTLLADAELALYGRIPTEETLGVTNVGLTPFADFDIADWVQVRYDTDQAPVERRVRQIAVAMDESGAINLGLTLNTILFEQDVALQRQMERLSGGGNSGGYGSTPNTDADITVPKPPVGLAINSGYYITGTGEYQGAFTAQWTAPTQNVDGSELSDLSHYEIQYRYTDAPVSEWSFLMRTSQQETIFGYSPVTPGRTIQVRVRATDQSANSSDWLTSTDHTLVTDTEAPPVPTTPDATEAIQSVRVRWDGLAVGNNPMPYDLAFVEVWQSAASGTTPGQGDSQLVHRFPPGGGEVSISGFADGQLVYVRLVAVDKAGNRSAASTEDSALRKSPQVSDNQPPTTAPVPTVRGGIGVLHVLWDAIENNDPVTYEVHLSTTDGFTPTPGDTATLAAETPATAISLKTLPNGDPLVLDTVYYVRLIAKDQDPGTLPVSAQASGSLFKVGDKEVSGQYGYIGTLTADAIITGTLKATITMESGVIRTASSGQRVEMDRDGLHLKNSANKDVIDLPTDPSKVARFAGQAEMSGLDVLGALTLYNAGHIAAGETSDEAGFLEIDQGVVAPGTAPGVTLDHEQGATPYTPTFYGDTNSDAEILDVALDATDAYLLTSQWDPSTGTNKKGLSKCPVDGGANTATIPLPIEDIGSGAAGVDVTGTAVWVASMVGPSAPIRLRKYDAADLTEAGQVWDVVPSQTITYIQGMTIIPGVSGAPTYAYVGCIEVISTFDHPVYGYSNKYRPRVVRVDLATGAFTVLTSDQHLGTSDLNGQAIPPPSRKGFVAGTFDYGDGLLRYIYNRGTTTYPARVFAITSGTDIGNARTDDSWTFESGPYSTSPFAWHPSGHFRQVRGLMDLQVPDLCTWIKYTGIMWTTESSQWYASYAWRDSLNGYLTEQSKRAPFTMSKRSRLRLTSAAIPSGGPDSVAFYLGRGSTDPGLTGMWIQTLPDLGATSLDLTSQPAFTGNPATDNPKATNTFPSAIPGLVRSPGVEPADSLHLKNSGDPPPSSTRQDGRSKFYADGFGRGRFDGLVPPGTIMMYAGAVAPPGWALCDGSTRNTATDPDLFAVIQYQFHPTVPGTNTGTTFYLPDLRRRVPVGVGTGLARGRNDGVTAEASRTFAHSHGAGTLATAATGSLAGTATGSTDRPTAGHTHNITGATANSAFDAIPNLGLNFIIKL